MGEVWVVFCEFKYEVGEFINLFRTQDIRALIQYKDVILSV